MFSYGVGEEENRMERQGQFPTPPEVSSQNDRI